MALAGAEPCDSSAPQRWRRRQRAHQAAADGETAEAAEEAGPAAGEPAEAPAGAERPPKAGELARHKPQEPCTICLEGFDGKEADCMPRTCRKCGNSFHQALSFPSQEQQIKWEQKPWMLPSQFESGSCPCCRSNKGHDKSRRWKK
ncbi:unnamed protein product [Prorocentrum cordatum]|uniref:RING-type domain-containing protein n=1 Tax=Prorocentrum cordatum TaxID=2364126 RepID=A0ABN9QJG9_9DINO|nr:unnamed protein product [Polarella glacialis]